VTSTSSIQANPYLFVFGANPLGYLEFKALDNASSLNASSKYLQVNGSTAEISKTMAILSTISTYETTGVMYAELEAAIAMDNKMAETNPATCPTPDPVSASSSGSGSGSSCSIDNTYSSTSTPKLPVNADVEIIYGSVADMERQLVKYANNIPSNGISAVGEVHLFGVELIDGKFIAGFNNGVNGECPAPRPYVAKVIEDNGKSNIKAIYDEHSHDKNTVLRQTNAMNVCYDSSGKRVPPQYVTPSGMDMWVSYSFSQDFKGVKFISRVFSSSGIGVEYDTSGSTSKLFGFGNSPFMYMNDLYCIYNSIHTNMTAGGRKLPENQDVAKGQTMYYKYVFENFGVKFKFIKDYIPK
jgi:hypothetical protein